MHTINQVFGPIDAHGLVDGLGVLRIWFLLFRFRTRAATGHEADSASA